MCVCVRVSVCLNRHAHVGGFIYGQLFHVYYYFLHVMCKSEKELACYIKYVVSAIFVIFPVIVSCFLCVIDLHGGQGLLDLFVLWALFLAKIPFATRIFFSFLFFLINSEPFCPFLVDPKVHAHPGFTCSVYCISDIAFHLFISACHVWIWKNSSE